MRRQPRKRRPRAILAVVLLVSLLLAVTGIAAQSVFSDPANLPGDSSLGIAAGAQSHAQIARGADSYLAVWTDSRTALNSNVIGTMGQGIGSGSMNDIYAARISAHGSVIDTTPFIVTQVGYNQSRPSVGWNGQNWLVVWLHQLENDYYKYQIRAARVSPAGQVLDAAPIVIDDAAHSGQFPFNVIDDGQGNWVISWEDFLPQEGTSIPRGVVATKVAADGTVLAPGARVIYNHHHQYMDGSKLTRAGDRLLLTYHDVVTPYGLYGIVYDAALNQMSSAPVLLTEWGPTDYSIGSDGSSWFGSWFDRGRLIGMRISRDGAPVDADPIVINSNLGYTAAPPRIAWDGEYWFVAYGSSFDPVTQTQLSDADVYISRVTAAGEVIDQSGFKVKAAPGGQTNVLIAPGAGGGAQVAWHDYNSDELFTARVSRDGAVGADVPYTLGAPRQSKVRMATDGTGFLAVFRSETSKVSRIMAQRLNADGAAADQQPFVVSPVDQTTTDNPSVGWDGTNYLVVWDAATTAGRKTYGAVVPAAGATAGTAVYLMDGEQPDAAGLNGQFLVVNIIQETSQIRKTQAVRVSAAGAPLGTPVKIAGTYNFSPRAAAFGNRWLAVWEFHGNHDDSPGTIHAAFVEQSGTVGAPFIAGDFGSDGSPHLAVKHDASQSLVVWASSADIRARRINADGMSSEPLSGTPLTANAALQARPVTAWDGSQFVVTWIDHRHETFPQQPKGDIYAARLSPTNTPVEEFAIANSLLPEELPFVTSLGGLTVFSYAKFDPQAPYAAHRIAIRTSRLERPVANNPPGAPTSLVAAEVNSGSAGTVTLTWIDPSDTETGFKIESRAGSGAWSQVAVAAANATSVSGLSASATDSTSFRVRAYSAAGDSGYSNESSAPVAVLSPFAPNTLNEPATVTATMASIADLEGIARVEFYSSTDGVNYVRAATDTVAPYSHQFSNLARGNYSVKAKAFDAQGATTLSSPESFIVYGSPAVRITSPEHQTSFPAGGNVSISAEVQLANSGESVLRMDFYAGGALIGTVQGNQASYNFPWQNAPSGAHQLTARATTSLNVTGTSAPVIVTVGAPASVPRVDAVSPNPIPRSGLVRITGANFGATQQSAQLTIGGLPSTYIAQWADDLIVAYVPEATAAGDVPVAITNSAGTGHATLNVTTRAQDGRIRWRFTVAAGHVPRRSAIGPDGTVYVNDVLGRLYALAPDGGLKWVFQAGLVGAMGPVSVGSDGTVYVGGLVPKDPATPCEAGQFLVNVEGVFAVRPDGTQKWLFNKTCDGLLSGPNVGPDGNIHVVTDSTGIGAFALKPNGTLAHAPTGRFGVDGSDGTEIVFGPAAPGQAPTQKYFQYESGGLFGYTLDGQRVFLYPTNAVGITQPVVGQQTGTVYTTPDHQTAGRFFAVSPQGALRWVSPIRPISNLSIPDAPPSESAVYIVQDGAKLHRVNPADGSVVWTFIDNYEQLFDPVASPDDRLVLMGGQANYNLPGFFEAVSSDGRQIWKQHLPNETGLASYGQVVPRYRARFTDDSQTAYIAAHVAGADYSATIPAYSFFYALDTSADNTPVNQPPRTTIVAPASGQSYPKNQPVEVIAKVEDDGAVDRVEFFYNLRGTTTKFATVNGPSADGNYHATFSSNVPDTHGIFAVAYDAGGLSGQSALTTIVVSNSLPNVSWVSPANNSTFTQPASITLKAKASDADGTITKVDFNSSVTGFIGSDTTPDAEGNYSVEFVNPLVGTHQLIAWASDDSGVRSATGLVSITVSEQPMPTPTPTPTPTPAPKPADGPTILTGPDAVRLAAVDSVLFTPAPFRLRNDWNFSRDQRTRITFFTTDLGFAVPTQPDLETLSVEIGGISYPVESVAPVAGLALTSIVLRLPDLPPGDWPVSIRVRGVNSENAALLTIIF